MPAAKPTISTPGRGAQTLRLSLVLAAALALGGCSSRLQGFTNSLSELGRDKDTTTTGNLSALARAYDSKPGIKGPSLAYATALRANGQHVQAVAVLQRTSIANVGDREVAAAYGKVLADVGRFEEARGVLAQAHTEDRPNWQVLSTLGSVSDQLGDHVRARDFYRRALQIAPQQASILNNLGLSYLLTKEMKLAEETLRKAAALPGADDRVRANLALALKLQGKSSG